MGYYITLKESDIFISKDDFEYCYEAMCKLNERDDLKIGGSWGDGEAKSKWFSWMDANYPETCKDMHDILFSLGFENHRYDKDGNLVGFIYDNKTGQQDLFLDSIAPYVKAGSYLNWMGEDGSLWQHSFNGKEMTMKSGVITWE